MILDEIGDLPRIPFSLPLPTDARLLKVAQELLTRPDDDRSLEALADWAGASSRTFTRKFAAETGFSFAEWRQRVRLLRALELIAAGRSVKSVALELGYANVSGFIALFKRRFGVTPGQHALATAPEGLAIEEA
ncbi:helix-turn-helix domain-containing protein [Roseateles sp. NT4]|uniref:helix-turn-helix domain-containing protein n=1 Tax=Roseateles sp. NT4 TaxID=3453715 RepID=UPI003EEA8E3E